MAQPTLVVLDPSIEDDRILLAGVRPDAWAAVLQPEQDGVAQITALLQALPNVSELHILSHGSAGVLYLGNSELSLTTLDRYAHHLNAWFTPNSYRSSAALHLYGCHLADKIAGATYMVAMHYLTGATVHASTHTVGSVALGGSWVLDAIAPAVRSRQAAINRVDAGREWELSLPCDVRTLTAYGGTLTADTDGDGIDDAVDLDDDNDGILDTVEAANALQNILERAAQPFRVSGTFQTSSGSEDQTVGSIAVYTLIDEAGVAIGYLRATAIDTVSNAGTTRVSWGELDSQPRVSVRSLDGDSSDTESATVRFEFFDLNSDVSALLAGEPGNRAEAVFTAVIGDLDHTERRTESVAAPIDSITGYTVDKNTILELSTTEIPGFVLATGTANDVGDRIISPDSIRFNYIQRSEFTLQFRTTNDGAGFQIDLRNALLYPNPQTTTIVGADSDGDRLNDSVDLDSDNDGIPDNIEAQTTRGYIAPTGNDADGNGLDDAYEATAGGGKGLVPIDSDGSTADGVGTQSLPNYLDVDSDDDGVPDVDENGRDGVVTPDDSDGDGLLDAFEGSDVNDGFDANDEINSPLNGILPDSDDDDTAGSSLSSGLDYLDNNTLPIARDNTVDVAEDTPISGNVIADPDPAAGQDSDADSDPLTVIGARVDVNGDGVEEALSLGITTEITRGGAVLGRLTLEATGAYSFLPAANVSGALPSVTYTLNDGIGTDTATLSIAVEPVDDAPEVSSGTIAAAEESTGIPLGLSAPTDADGDALRITVTGLPRLGALTLADGTPLTPGQILTAAELEGLLYDGPADYDGARDPGDFTYAVTDGTSTITGVTDFSLTAVNDAPLVSNVAIAVDEESSRTLGLTAPTDAEGEALTITVSGLPVLGAVTLADGTPITHGQTLTAEALEGLRYDAPAEYDGARDPGDLTYTVTDGRATVTGRTTVTLSAINDAPVVGQAVAIAAAEESQGTPLGIAAPVDADGDLLTLIVSELPALGTVTLADGTSVTDGQPLTAAELGGLLYDAPADYDGASDPGTFRYSVSDGSDTVTGSVDFDLSAVNDRPVVGNSAIAAAEESTRTPLGLAVPTDADGDPLALTISELPALGTVTLASGAPVTDGQPLTPAELAGLIYNAPADYDGVSDPGRFTYAVTDGTDTVTGAADIALTPINDAPVARNVAIAADEESARTLLGMTAPTDADGDLLTLTVTELPALGTLTADGTPLVLGQVLAPETLEGLLYDAPADYDGAADPGKFTYAVSDGTATVTGRAEISLNAIDDVPVVGNAAIAAAEESTRTPLGLAAPTDADGDPLTLTVTELPALGRLILADGTPVTVGQVLTPEALEGLLYNAPADYDGAADPGEFTYSVTDGTSIVTGTARITLIPINDVPTAGDAGGAAVTALEESAGVPLGLVAPTDADGDALTIAVAGLPALGLVTLEDGRPVAAGQFLTPEQIAGLRYDAPADYDGVADPGEFTYLVSDGAVTVTGLVDVTLIPVNDLPVASDDIYTAVEDVPLVVMAIAGVLNSGSGPDRDADGDILTVLPAALTTEGGGTVTLAADGGFTYFPAASYSGSDRFSYEVIDGKGGSDIGTVTLIVKADADSDGIPDEQDADGDNDGIPDTVEQGGDPTRDTDGDGLIDSLDLDADGDGIFDSVESGYGAADFDGDGRLDGPTFGTNGLLDSLETAANSGILTALPTDTDGDRVFDFQDLDSDNDGILDVTEGGDRDTDGDRRPDFQDLDSDNDGVSDLIESGIDAARDPDGNGAIDKPDTDGDGISDPVDETATFGRGPSNPLPDRDGDGVPDVRDLDSDGDGVFDRVEFNLATGLRTPDSDRDGQVDDPTDSDADGIPDAIDSQPGRFGGFEDSDGDGITNDLDLDDDNDGILDTVEQGGDPLRDTDGDGLFDSLDTDADGDGLFDVVEAGYGIADTNSDGRIDGRPEDFGPNGLLQSLHTGSGGALIPVDTDGDRIPDFRDLDSDNDGVGDLIEGGGRDADGDGLADEPVLAPLRDTDGDRRPDFRDLDSDNDGVPDLVEAGIPITTDPDGNGAVDGPDADGDGIADVLDGVPTAFGSGPSAPLPDGDGDGVPDGRELDSDGDGVSDRGEAGLRIGPNSPDADGDGQVDSPADADADGVPDAIDSQPGGFGGFEDSDGDGVIDAVDLDDDNDGIPDAIEDQGRPNRDTDGDGILDRLDLDADNDGISDLAEADGSDLDGDGRLEEPVGRNGLADSRETAPDSGLSRGFPPDSDGDRVFDFQDLDSDNDGLADVTEAGGPDPDQDGLIGQGAVSVTPSGLSTSGILEALDQDGDGLANYRDRDSDNDGRFDLQEASLELPDGDNDGRIDGMDSDGDGILDVIDAAAGAPGTTPFSFAVPGDADGNGVPDTVDSPRNRRDGQLGQLDMSGDDILNGFSDPDDLNGRDGSDILNGGSDADQLVGGADSDILNGGTNRDRLRGGTGDDILNGGGGADRLLGGAGHDILNGGSGSDLLRGGAGRDILNGGTGHDRLRGDRGRDRLRGGRGHDLLIGGAGGDQLSGGQGRDRFGYGRVGEFGDVITDFEILQDRIDLRRVRGVAAVDLVLRQRGDHSLVRVQTDSGIKTLALLEDVSVETLGARHFLL